MSLVFLYISDAIEADFNRKIQVVKGKIWMLYVIRPVYRSQTVVRGRRYIRFSLA